MTQSSAQPGTGWPVLTLFVVVEQSFLFFPSSSGRVDHSFPCVTMEQSCLPSTTKETTVLPPYSNAQSSPTLTKLDGGSELQRKPWAPFLPRDQNRVSEELVNSV